MSLLISAGIIAAVALIASYGESCSDNIADCLLPSAAIVVIGLIIGDLLWMAK